MSEVGMMDREKVIKGLQGVFRCVSPVTYTCGDCPYQDNRVECKRRALNDALALLKAQEPRVMTLEEIDNRLAESSEEYNKIFWAEVKSRTRYSFGVFQLSILDDDDYEALLLGCSWSALYRRSSYGIRWRCWTSRPTDEQRKEARWDE